MKRYLHGISGHGNYCRLELYACPKCYSEKVFAIRYGARLKTSPRCETTVMKLMETDDRVRTSKYFLANERREYLAINAKMGTNPEAHAKKDPYEVTIKVNEEYVDVARRVQRDRNKGLTEAQLQRAVRIMLGGKS